MENKVVFFDILILSSFQKFIGTLDARLYLRKQKDGTRDSPSFPWRPKESPCLFLSLYPLSGNDLIEPGVSSPDRRSAKSVFLPRYLLLHCQIIRLLKTSHYQYL